MTLKSHVEVFIKKAINDTQRLRGRQEHYSTQRQLRVVPILNVRITKTSHKKKKKKNLWISFQLVVSCKFVDRKEALLKVSSPALEVDGEQFAGCV